MRNKIKSKTTSKILVCGLCSLFTASALVGLNLGASAAIPTAVVNRPAIEDVTGQYSLDDVRAANFDKSLMTDAPAPLNGRGSVIVDLDGVDLYTLYEQSGQTLAFTDFISTDEGNAQYAELIDGQNRVLDAMRKKGIEYELKYNYTALSNSFSVVIDYADMNAVEQISGVKSVYYSNSYEAPIVEQSDIDEVVTNNANVYSTGIYNTDEVKQMGYDGAGMVVAVLDTGLDYTHAAFRNMPENKDGIWDLSYIEEAFGKTMAKTSRAPNAKATDVYINEKVPYAFDYADDDTNVYPSYSTHGTHVAGIVAGYDEGKSFGNNEKFVGVAPEAQLVIMKVFTDDLSSKTLGGADADDILAAVNDCAVLGVDVINMSLGSTCGFTSTETEDFLTEVYDKVGKMGISLIVAAGNESSSGSGGGNGMNLASNPDSGTVGSPSTYASAMSVASINGKEAPYFVANAGSTGESTAFITNAADVYSNDIEFVDQLFDLYGNGEGDSLTFTYVVVGGVGRAANFNSTVTRALESNYPAIALVKRGDISFSEKVENAMNAGAAGVIVYNNVSGEIRMSLADVEDPVPTCSIGLNDGTAMVNAATRSVGTFTINKSYTAGPFMSSFSSLGVTPDLQLKPEITAHGGEIYSAVPGGYDTYSGTSMASPNMAGVYALMRQYLSNEQGLTNKALNARANQLLMSTATIARNPDGNPYSPRKQGAGLADISAAMKTKGYIVVPEGQNKSEYGDGVYSDKTKIEFGDDAERKGEYKGAFVAVNRSDETLRYTLDSYVFTETLAINKLTVEENAYMFNKNDVTFTVNNKTLKNGDTVDIEPGESVTIEATVKLSAEEKKLLDTNFENGMYVEGYFRLLANSADGVNLSVPYLAYYGDWGDAPLFDYSVFELAVTDADKSLEESEKPKATARATTPLGLYNDGQYIMPLGTYLYEQDENEVEIFPSEEKCAVSMYDEVNRRTMYQLYMIYGGLLRGAKTLTVTITDAVTGEQVYHNEESNVRKAYSGGGGSGVGSPIRVEMNPYEWGLANNKEYVFTMQGTIDWNATDRAVGGKANNDTFEFSFHVDYEAPTIQSYSVRFDPYVENKKTKYNIYLDVNVYDNQYVSALLPCYVRDSKLTLLTEYAVPVYSQQNSVTKVSFDITELYEDHKTDIYLGVEDYAMNQSIYRLNLTKATTYCDSLEFQEDNKLDRVGTLTGNVTLDGKDITYEYGEYDITMAPNEVYNLTAAKIEPENTYSYKLEWLSNRSNVAVAYENQIYAKSAGNAIISVRDGNGVYKARINVTVSGSAVSEPGPIALTFKPVINKDKFVQALPNGATLELYPNSQVQLEVEADPWYTTDKLDLTWSSNNPDVASVDDNGNIVTHKHGVAWVTVSANGYNRVTASVRVSVATEFRIVNYTLYEYHGGPDVVIPDELNVMYIDEDTFKGNTDITSLSLPKTVTEIGKNVFEGCTSLREITLHSATIVINQDAFRGCTSLETIYLKPFIDEDFPVEGEEMIGALTVGNRAFMGCTSLKEILDPETGKNSLRVTTVGFDSFAGCSSLKELDLSGLAVSYDRAFAGCSALEKVTFSQFTAPAVEMFKGCSSLTQIDYPMSYVADGMFEGCSDLEEVTFSNELTRIGSNAFAGAKIKEITIAKGNVVIDENAFADCKELTTFTIGKDASVIFQGRNPFSGCDKFNKFVVEEGNANHKVIDGILYNADGTEIQIIPESSTNVELPAGVSVIGNNLFAGNKNLTQINLGNITSIGAYAFAETGLTKITIPASVTDIGKGAFYGCTNLTEVVFADGIKINAIADEMFYGCENLTSIAIPESVNTEIGAYAFARSGLQSIDYGDSLPTVIGDYAFYRSFIRTVSLPNTVTEIGDYAYAEIRSLTAVTVPAVEKMGVGAFMNAPMLTAVTVADGAKVIGDSAFAWTQTSGASALATVNLSDTVVSIGDRAFYNTRSLKTIDLSHVSERIGAMAFMNSGITSLDTAAKIIDILAFANTSALSNAKLDAAQYVNEQAFVSSGVSSVSFKALKGIGANAFTDTKLKTVNLPATLDSYSYTRSLVLYSPGNGKFEEYLVNTESFGAGAFSAIPTLESITVDAGSPVYYAVDGVLYADSKNGKTLVQYPAARAGEEYSVENGVIRIEADAFNSVRNLVRVTVPASTVSIGSRAFYASSVKEYTFESVKAPVLDSAYINPASIPTSDILYRIFSSTSLTDLGSQVYYANFYDYVAKITEESKLNEMGNKYVATRFGLKITYPENGVDYDNLIWTSFFDEYNLSDYAADAYTLSVIKAINAIPAPDDIDKATTIAELDNFSNNYIAPARTLYNAVGDEKQRAFIDNETLENAEIAVRAKRAALGAPVKVVSVRFAATPVQLRFYDGETFDPTGMRVIAVYDDKSEEEVTGYTVSPTAMTVGVMEVTVTYEGVSARFDVSVLQKTERTVTFVGDGVKTFTVTAIEGRPVAEPAVPTRKGYDFDGWYIDDQLFDFTQNISGDITLTAHWTANGEKTDDNGIVGIIVAAILIVGCAVAAVYFVLASRKKNKKTAQAPTDESVSTTDSDDDIPAIDTDNAYSAESNANEQAVERVDEPTIEQLETSEEVNQSTDEDPDSEKPTETTETNSGEKAEKPKKTVKSDAAKSAKGTSKSASASKSTSKSKKTNKPEGEK